jgi:nucleoside-diphosphate-sugar epimerase
MQRVVVTGADGFVGRALSARLETAGCRVTRIVRAGSDREAVAVGDLAHFSGWPNLLRNIDAVVHCAARAHVLEENVPDPLAEFRRINVAGTLRLAEAAAASGVRRFVFLSSIGVNGVRTLDRPFSESDTPDPTEPYAISKWEAERVLVELSRRSEMRITRVRPPLIVGPGAKGNLLRLLKLVDRRVPLPLGAVRNSRSFVVLDDLCELLWRCLTQDAAANELFLAANAEEISTPEMIRVLAAGLGCDIRLIPVPVALLRAAAGLLGAKAPLDRLIGSLRVNGKHARERLDWQPRTSLSAAFSSMARTYLTEKQAVSLATRSRV